MKRMTMVFVVVTGCSFSSKLTTSTMGSGGAGGGQQGAAAASVVTVRMPDLTGMTKDQALQALQRAGYETRTVAESDQLCPAREPMLAQGTICDQQPRVGSENSVQVPVRVTVEHDTPNHGRIGTNNEWRLMPDITGKRLDEAKAILTRAGFDVSRHFEFLEGRCTVNTICQTSPRAGSRVVLSRGGRIEFGAAAAQPPAAKPEGDGGYF